MALHHRDRGALFCALALAPGILLAPEAGARVYTGLEVFLAHHKDIVKGKRVGLITNQTGVDARGRSTIDLFHADPAIDLRVLFAPEHGIRGTVKAGDTVPGGKDPKTGLPIVSLYGGKDHKPPKDALAKVDVLIYDIQDVGSRCYTYVWHMAECMKAAAENGKTMIVLDRPNPLGARVMDGPITEPRYISFIGLYPVPRTYGMTVGELARYLNVREKINAKLYVVPMANYQRGMAWQATGLPWVPPSPNIPTTSAACCFAATGTIGEIGAYDLGLGSPEAFQIVVAEWINPKLTADALNRLKLPGVTFVPARTTKKNVLRKGVAMRLTDPTIFHPTLTEVAILSHLRRQYPDRFRFAPDNDKKRLDKFDKAMGTANVRRLIDKGVGAREIAKTWQPAIEAFRQQAEPFFIYK